MPFLRLHTANRNNSTANSLRAYLDVLYQTGPLKRASSFALPKRKASMTVEAAFVLPLFLFFMVQVMSAIDMIGQQSRFNAALHQTGNRMAFAGYLSHKAIASEVPEEIVSTGLTDLYAINQILDYVGKSYLDRSCVENGAAGIRGAVSFDGADRIKISVSYRVKPLFPVIGFQGFEMKQGYYGRLWTGYDVEEGRSDLTQNDPMVYVTETGTVYHTNRECTYLNPSITRMDKELVGESRNQSGGKYHPCEICGMGGSGETVYITDQGSSYHTVITCSGLKRTIYTIPLSQAEGRRRCSKCR